MIFKDVVILRAAHLQTNDDMAIDIDTLTFPAWATVSINFDNNHPVGYAKNFYVDGDNVYADIEINAAADPYDRDMITKLDLVPCAGVMVQTMTKDGERIKPLQNCKLTHIGLATPNLDPGIKPLSAYGHD